MPSMRLSLVSVLVALWVSRAHAQGRTCDFPEIKHGSIYEEDRYKQIFPVATWKYFYYSCDRSFASPSQSLWTRITCTEEGWSPTPKCLRQCFFPWVENGRSASSGQMHQEGDTVQIICDEGYSLPLKRSSITCGESGWSLPPTCSPTDSGRKCGPPPAIDNGDITTFPSAFYAPGDSVEYRCQAYYKLQGNKTVTCRDGKWSVPPTCLETSCPSPPSFNNANAININRRKKWYQPGQEVAYECAQHHRLDGSNVVRCVAGRWVGTPTCRDNSCGSPPIVENAIIHNKKTRYLPDERVRYECLESLDLFGDVEVTCRNGNWTEPPQCKEAKGKCKPPPTINNGDITTFPSAVYAPGDSVEYRCQAYYKLQGNRIITCRDGEWSEPPKCLEACVVSEEMMEKHNIRLKWRYDQQLYSETDDTLEFTCRYGYYEKSPPSAFRVTCREGKLTYPTCE